MQDLVGLSWAEGGLSQTASRNSERLNLQASASSLHTVKPVEMHQRLPDTDKTPRLLVGRVARLPSVGNCAGFCGCDAVSDAQA